MIQSRIGIADVLIVRNSKTKQILDPHHCREQPNQKETKNNIFSQNGGLLNFDVNFSIGTSAIIFVCTLFMGLSMQIIEIYIDIHMESKH